MSWLRNRAEYLEERSGDLSRDERVEAVETIAREFAERALRKHEVNCGYSFDETLVGDQEIAEALAAADTDD